MFGVLLNMGIHALHLPILSAHTHSSEHTHTHTVNTHLEQPFMLRRLGSLWVRCLAQGHLSGIEGEESAVHSLSPPTISASPRLELATFGLQF